MKVSIGTRLGQPMVIDYPGVVAELIGRRDPFIDALGMRNWSVCRQAKNRQNTSPITPPASSA